MGEPDHFPWVLLVVWIGIIVAAVSFLVWLVP